MRTRLLVFAIAVAFVLSTAAAALAVPITSISGNYTGPVGPFGPSSTITWGVPGSINVTNGTVPIPGSTPLANGFTIGQFTTLPGNTGLSGQITIVIGGNATFALPGLATIATALSTTGVDTAPNGTFATLLSNATGFDLGLVGSLWRFQTSFQGVNTVADAPGTFQVVGSGTTSTSFTLDFVRNPGGGDIPFPEPSSLVVWGTLIGAGWLTRRLRRKVD